MLNENVTNLALIDGQIQSLAAAEGLVYLGAAPLNTLADYARFAEWLVEGKHAGMAFLERNQQFREHPEALLPGAKAALVFGLNYNLGDRSVFHYETPAPRIAQYARMRDYHKVLKQRCTRIAKVIHDEVEQLNHTSDHKSVAFRVLVDSAPILERAVASQTGKGFIGKNTCFISPTLGSFVLLAEILTTIEPGAPKPKVIDSKIRTKEGGCGSCQRCQVHCPTGALDSAWNLDARKCLSYWTIEHRGVIPEDFWPWLGTYWFGCDICQLVCPWNRKAEVTTEVELRRLTSDLDLADVAMMSQEFYETTFGGSPMTRAKREGLRRNAMIAMAVTGHKQLKAALDLADADDTLMLRETATRVRQWLQARQNLPS